MTVPPDFVSGDILTAAQMNLAGSWVVKRDTITAGSSSHIITGAFNADYTNYLILITGLYVAAGTPNITGQLRIGASTAATTYFWGGTNSNYTVRTDENSGGTTTSWKLGQASTTVANHFAVQVFRPFDAAVTTFYSNSASTVAAFQIGGYHNQATSYDQFVITPASSTLSGGTITVIGYRD